MDLIPKPDQVVAAAGNVAHTLLYGGLADLRPMPRTLIDDGELREVYHYRPAADVAADRRPGAAGEPARRAVAVLRPAARLLAGRAPRDRRPPDLPRGVRPGLLQEPRARHGALGRRGAARGDPGGARALRRPRRAPGRAGASAASSRCSSPPTGTDLPDRLADRDRLPRRRHQGAAGRAGAPAAQPRPGHAASSRGPTGRSAAYRRRSSTGPSPPRRRRRSSPSRWRC